MGRVQCVGGVHGADAALLVDIDGQVAFAVAEPLPAVPGQ
jgi:hypothetical protein